MMPIYFILMFQYEEKEIEFSFVVSESTSEDINVHFIRMLFIFEEDEEKTRRQLADVIKAIFEIEERDWI